MPAITLLCCLIGTATLSAQGKAPKRPRLSSADTNDARAYFAHGVQVIEHDADEAQRAFYWASRIDPGFAEALYARRVAGFLANDALVVRYMEDARGYTAKEAQQLDTLEFRAQMLNPFYRRELDRQFISGYLIASINQERRRTGARLVDSRDRPEIDYLIEEYLRTGTSLRLRAGLTASDRRFPEALDLYRRALRESRDKIGVLLDRARVFALAGQGDSALAGLAQALDSLRRRDSDRLVRFYQSKEFFEHSIGVIHERRGDLTLAREAYGRALQENLSYYPAHVRLGLIALAAGDTTTALAELDLATQVATTEATACVTYAVLLTQTGRHADAEAQARKAITLEPHYALPYVVLGQAAELTQKKDAAVAAYSDFLARASWGDPRRKEVEQRLADLKQD